MARIGLTKLLGVVVIALSSLTLSITADPSPTPLPTPAPTGSSASGTVYAGYEATTIISDDGGLWCVLAPGITTTITTNNDNTSHNETKRSDPHSNITCAETPTLWRTVSPPRI